MASTVSPLSPTCSHEACWITVAARMESGRCSESAWLESEGLTSRVSFMLSNVLLQLIEGMLLRTLPLALQDVNQCFIK